MDIDGLFAALCVTDIDASAAFYAKVLGREPDDRPMETLVQWRGFGGAGIQLVRDTGRAGRSLMTVVVSDIDGARAALAAAGVELGDTRQGDFGRIAQLEDPDGNVVTLAEPPKGLPVD